MPRSHCGKAHRSVNGIYPAAIHETQADAEADAATLDAEGPEPRQLLARCRDGLRRTLSASEEEAMRHALLAGIGRRS